MHGSPHALTYIHIQIQVQGSISHNSIACISSLVGGSPNFAPLNNLTATNACFNTATSAVGNVDYWISDVSPQFGQSSNGTFRVFNISTDGVISADNYLGEPNCISQTSCVSFRTATGIKGNTSNSIDAPFATYAIPIGIPNSSPIYFPTDGSPWGVRLSGPAHDGSTIVSWQSGRAKLGNNTALFSDLQYNGGSPLVGQASVSLSTISGKSLSHPTLTLTGNCYTYIRALDGKVAVNQGYSYLSPLICHVIIPGQPLGSTDFFYTVSTKSTNGTWISSSEKGPVKPIGSTPTFPLVIGLMADNGQTINSSLTATRMAAMNLHAIIHPGDYSYGDNYAANDPNSLIAGTNSGGHNDNRHDSFHAMWEKVLSKTPELHCVGNHEIESGQCALVDSLGNIVKDNVCRINSTTFDFSFPSNWPFQSFAWRYPAPGSSLDDIGNINKATYYSTVIAGLVYLITLNNYIPFYPGTPQHTWTLAAFAAYDRKKTPWLFVQFHAPIYHTYFTHYKEQECFNSIFEPLFYSYGVDMVFSGHVHAYERTHSIYNYNRDPCGTMHVTIGDGGNIEGPYRNFIDDIFPYTNTTYCEVLRGASSGPLSSSTSHDGGLYVIPNTPPNDPKAVAANLYGAGYQIASQLRTCPTMSFQASNGVKGGPVSLPYSGPFNESSLNDPRNSYDPSKGPYGFCQTSQPVWSAYRDPSFGFATLTFESQDVITLRWFNNIDPAGEASDTVTILRKNSCNRSALGNAGKVFNSSFHINFYFINEQACRSASASPANLKLAIQLAIAQTWNARATPLAYTPIAAGDVTISHSSFICWHPQPPNYFTDVVINFPVEIKRQQSENEAFTLFMSSIGEVFMNPAIVEAGIVSTLPDRSKEDSNRKVVIGIIIALVAILIIAAFVVWLVPLFRSFREKFQELAEERLSLMKDVEMQRRDST